MSRPLQVFLDEADLDRLDAWARARGWTKSQAVRNAILHGFCKQIKSDFNTVVTPPPAV